MSDPCYLIRKRGTQMQKKACAIAAILKKMIIKTAVFMAILDANQACTFWGYQESEPKSVKQLRKF